jgi:catechol 1,2-dioxygenase
LYGDSLSKENFESKSKQSQVNEAGQMSTDVRNEGQLVCDVLGLESLVDEITYKLASEAEDQPTATAILGPFWRKDAPKKKMGESVILKEMSDGERTYMHGTVTDFKTGKPIEGAELDIWHTAPNGMYEQQDPDQPDFNLRGRFTTGPGGKYDLYCLKPTAYPIPFDGPAGRLLQMLDRHPMRPAHIHFIVSRVSEPHDVKRALTRLNRCLHLVTNQL